MKKRLINTGWLVLLLVASIPMCAQGQQSEVKVVVHQDDGDSTVTNSFYSNTFDVDDFAEMHRRLDSVLATLDKKLKKKIRIMAFNADSVYKHFKLNGDVDFKDGWHADSILSWYITSPGHKRTEERIKIHSNKADRQHVVIAQNDMLAKKDGYSLELSTYSKYYLPMSVCCFGAVYRQK